MKKEQESLSVLLVEDNEDDVLIAQRAFREFKVITEVHVARDGQEALDMLAASGRHTGKKPLRPALILLDITLPLMDGMDVLKRIKAAPDMRGIPVIMLTTSSRQEDIVRSYQNGAASYITKPASLEEFLDLARRFEDYWVTVSKLPV
ncbi:MAG TPA: two-component system response regulator [Elusimicrobia bacterium]|nr:two-component system response regulator [Elusimicrobiota bacterium]